MSGFNSYFIGLVKLLRNRFDFFFTVLFRNHYIETDNIDIMKKNLLVLLALCFFAFGCSEKYDLTPKGNNSDKNKDNGPIEMTENMLKVISFNIKFGSDDDKGDQGWPKRKPYIIKLLKDENPTIFGVQEAMKGQLDYMKKELSEYDSYGVGRGDGVSSSEHMTIFWKKDEVECGQHGTFWLTDKDVNTPNTGWDATIKRTATWAIMTHKPTNKKFFYMNTHLDHKGTTAQEQSILLIINKMAELNPNGYPAILTADFNLNPSSSYLAPLKKLMEDARMYAPRTDVEPTCHGWSGKTQVIDHIYSSKFKTLEFGVNRSNYGHNIAISDHYPVYAILEFK